MAEPDNGTKDFRSLYFRLVDTTDVQVLKLLHDPNLQYRGNVEAMIVDYEQQKASGRYDVRVMDARLASLRKIQEADDAFIQSNASFDDGAAVSCHNLFLKYESERINSTPAATPAATPKKSLSGIIIDAMKGLKLL